MGTCSCIKGESGNSFNFKLEPIDCETLIFTDLSDWMDDDNYVVPISYPITITTPTKQQVELVIAPGSNTVIRGSDLKQGTCLLDGIYCFTIETCGIKYSRHSAIVCTLDCKIDTLISQAQDKEDFDKISEIKNYTESAKINSRLGKPKKANEMFKLAEKELNKLNCDCG